MKKVVTHLGLCISRCVDSRCVVHSALDLRSEYILLVIAYVVIRLYHPDCSAKFGKLRHPEVECELGHCTAQIAHSRSAHQLASRIMVHLHVYETWPIPGQTTNWMCVPMAERALASNVLCQQLQACHLLYSAPIDAGRSCSGLTGDHKSVVSLYDAPPRSTVQDDQTVAGAG